MIKYCNIPIYLANLTTIYILTMIIFIIRNKIIKMKNNYKKLDLKQKRKKIFKIFISTLSFITIIVIKSAPYEKCMI